MLDDELESIREKLMGDISDAALRKLQTRMDALEQWSRLSMAGDDVDHAHMADEDHHHKLDSGLGAIEQEIARSLAARAAAEKGQ